MAFVWYELATSDVDAALTFYGTVLGWTHQDFPGPGPRYVIVSANGKGVGGVMHLPEGCPKPSWLGYLPVPDIEAAVGKFTSAGGQVRMKPWDIPMVGRLAVLADPQGAAVAMIQPASSQPSDAFNQALPGHGNWHELRVADPEAAFTFYAAQFGWTAGDAMPMGEMGVYQIFKDGDAMIGGMMRLMGDMPPSWLFYFGVEKIDAAVERVTGSGGTILHGPAEVPGGAFIVQALDPQGAAFALVGPR